MRHESMRPIDRPVARLLTNPDRLTASHALAADKIRLLATLADARDALTAVYNDRCSAIAMPASFLLALRLLVEAMPDAIDSVVHAPEEPAPLPAYRIEDAMPG